MYVYTLSNYLAEKLQFMCYSRHSLIKNFIFISYHHHLYNVYRHLEGNDRLIYNANYVMYLFMQEKANKLKFNM